MVGEIRVEGLSAFRRELRSLESETNWNRELTRGMRSIAQKAAEWSRDEARRMGGQQAHFADALAGRGTGTTARVQVQGPRTPKGKARANPAFWGTNAQGNWIGIGWDVAAFGEGPYAINAALFAHRDELIEALADMFDRFIAQAFPD